jgi:uncharacterized membrane protein YesL
MIGCTMLAALWVIGRAFNDVRLKGYTYIWANFAFLVLALPIVTLPASYSALCRVAYTAQKEPWDADLDLFWQTFKANLGRALPWGVAHAGFAVVNFSNWAAYGERPEPIWQVFRVLWLSMTLIWIGVLLYTWFIYYEMETPTLWGATRNALVMVLLNPFFTLVLILCIIILSVVSTALLGLWLMLTWGVIAAFGAAAVADRLAMIRQIAPTDEVE